jgi:hypothetical protein
MCHRIYEHLPFTRFLMSERPSPSCLEIASVRSAMNEERRRLHAKYQTDKTQTRSSEAQKKQQSEKKKHEQGESIMTQGKTDKVTENMYSCTIEPISMPSELHAFHDNQLMTAK